jgi:hypothetical protein
MDEAHKFPASSQREIESLEVIFELSIRQDITVTRSQIPEIAVSIGEIFQINSIPEL